jgi:hypothetical protein
VTAATCAGPGCTTLLEGGPAGRRYCGARCRKAAYRDRVRATRPAPARTPRTRRQPPEHLEAAAEELARDLEREAERSLARDPGRWKWRRSSEVPDHYRRIRS